LVIILVIVFGWIEFSRRNYLGHDWLSEAPGLLELLFRGFRRAFLARFC
jgi:hypothetical protein